MRRFIIGFTVRLVLSVVISLAVVWLFFTPFDRIPLPQSVVVTIIRIVDFPVAFAGNVLPIRGMEVLSDNHSSWCDFCTLHELYWQQLRLAVPIYLLLLYVPKLITIVSVIREKSHSTFRDNG